MAQDILIAGATGLVGHEILLRAVKDESIGTIFSLGRRAPDISEKKIQFVSWDFSSPVKWGAKKPKKPVAICTLGTTIKVAGSQEAFRKVDYDYVVRFAEMANECGAVSVHIVTAHGVSSKSTIFYNRVKGEVEDKLRGMKLPSLHIYRPSLLLGERKEKRAGEGAATAVAKFLMPVFSLPGLKNIQPTPAGKLADYILKTAKNSAPGNHVHSNGEILKL